MVELLGGLQQDMVQFGEIVLFLEENSIVAPATSLKILSLLGDSKRLQLELATVIDSGEAFQIRRR